MTCSVGNLLDSGDPRTCSAECEDRRTFYLRVEAEVRCNAQREASLFTSAALIFVLGVFACAAQAFADGPAPTATSDVSPEPRSPPPAPKRLDLRVPHINKLYTSEEIERILARARDIEEVEVEGTREAPPPPTPDVWGGLAAPVWGVLNPTQSWRILAPIPPDRAEALGKQPDATETYREPIRPPHLEP